MTNEVKIKTLQQKHTLYVLLDFIPISIFFLALYDKTAPIAKRLITENDQTLDMILIMSFILMAYGSYKIIKLSIEINKLKKIDSQQIPTLDLNE